MGTAAEQLSNATREELIEAFLSAVQSVQQKDDKIEQLQHQLYQLQKMIFGARSEKSRTLYPDHPTLFDVQPSEAEPEVETEEVTVHQEVGGNKVDAFSQASAEPPATSPANHRTG